MLLFPTLLTVPFPPLAAIWRAATLALGLAIGVPLRSGSLESHPKPARAYDDAVARANRRQATDDSVVAPGGRSLLLVHGRATPRAVLLLHGFTDSPRQFEVLAGQLYAAGDNVYVPRLPHHAERGADARTLARLTAGNLRDCADSAVDVAHGLGDTVIVLGLSVGGTMAAWIAQNRSDVQRAVMIAPALQAGRVPSMLDRPLVDLSARVPNVTRRAAPDTTRPDRDPGFTTHAIAQILQLGMSVLRAAKSNPPESREMVFLVNPNDHTVKESAARTLAGRWTKQTGKVTYYELPDSLKLPHNIVDPYRQTGGGAPVLALLQSLAHGEPPAAWVQAVPIR